MLKSPATSPTLGIKVSTLKPLKLKSYLDHSNKNEKESLQITDNSTRCSWVNGVGFFVPVCSTYVSRNGLINREVRSSKTN